MQAKDDSNVTTGNKVTGLRRITPASVLALILLWLLVVFAVLYFQQQRQSGQADLEEQRGRVADIANAMSATLQDWWPRLTTVEEASRWPRARTVCVIDAIPEQPQAGSCLPISYATLNLLYQARDQGRADVAVINAGKNDAYLLLVRQLEGAAMMLVAADIRLLDELARPLQAQGGHWRLRQGDRPGIALRGDADMTTPPPISIAVGGSFWHVDVWPGQAAVGTRWPLLGTGLLLVTLLWWLVLRKLPLPAMSARKRVNTRPDFVRAGHELQLDPVKGNIEVSTETQSTSPRAEKSDNPLPDYAIEKQGMDEEESITPAPSPEAQQDAAPLQFDQGESATPAPEQVEVDAPAGQDDTSIHFETAPASMPQESDVEAAVPVAETHIDPVIFKAYDIRGLVDTQLDEHVMRQLGLAVGSEARDRGHQRLVIGRDGRDSSEALARSFIDGVLTTGCDVTDIGCAPTPLVYFACEQSPERSGAVVTGSHNPAGYNGLKIVLGGVALAGESIFELESRIRNKRFHGGRGELSQLSMQDTYVDQVCADVTLARKMNVVVDCGSGVAGPIVPELLRRLGCQVTELFCEVDGRFPHHHPNPGQPENLQDLIRAVKSHDAELGLAFDGDGDRLGIVDAQGNIIWPDRLLLLLAQDVLSREPGATIVYDVKSTNLLEEVIGRAGGRPLMSPSGHSLIRNTMQEVDAKLGGELSGHIFFRDRWYGFDDALYSAARLLECLAADPLERTPTEIFAALPQRFATPEILVAMPPEEAGNFIAQLREQAEFPGGQRSTLDGLRIDFPHGWGLVRVSNTEPGIMLRFEARSKEELAHIKHAFSEQMLRVKPSLTLIL